MKYKNSVFLRSLNLEVLIWIIGLLYLAFISTGSSNHFTVCPLKNMGFNYCPGCGLGMSIHHLLHFEFLQSLKSHPLGLPAFAILIIRIITLIKANLQRIHNQSFG